MKKFILIVVLFLYPVLSLFAQPDVLFLLPGSNSYIASRAYNMFEGLYRGKSYWEDIKTVSEQTINQYNYIVSIEENISKNGYQVTVKTYFNGSNGTSLSSSYGSSLGNNASYKIEAIKIAFQLIKDLDPDFFEEVKDIFDNF